MKYILSPYDDVDFNVYLLEYIKKSLKKRCRIFSKDDSARKHYLHEDSDDFYTPDDIIKSLELRGRSIQFCNQLLINHAVYDLSQRFWYEELSHINNIIHKLYLEFKRLPTLGIQQRKLSHVKQSPMRKQGAKR